MTTAVMRMDCEKRQASSVEKEDNDEPDIGVEAELEAAPRAPMCAVSRRRHTRRRMSRHTLRCLHGIY
jgi:hypothetical protein